MYKIGLKLWSINKQYINEAQRLYDEGFYRYIELFVVPETFDNYINIWKSIKIPFIIHAPHFTQGLNFAKQECFEKNKIFAAEALKFADALNAEIVIFHPGVEGDIKETARQMKKIYDPRIVIENKPYYSCDGKFICNGHAPEEINFILNEVGVGFCMDIAHAVYAANAKKQDRQEFLQKFLTLKPRLFHVADGDWFGVFDRHEHIGKGNFDFNQICSLVSFGAKMTIESKHDFEDKLVDFVADVNALITITDSFRLQEIYFSKVQFSDVDDLYVLANDPVVRKNSLRQACISWDNHVTWLNEKLQDEHCVFYVIRNKLHAVVGQLRFDEIKDDPKKYVVSFSLTKNFRGRGLGATILKESVNQFQKNKLFECLIAYIKKDNQASLKCFLNAGFHHEGEIVLHGSEVYKLLLNDTRKI